MTHQPLVSIIMPSYNAAQFIAESIESVLAQTYVDWELLITDDCSKDQTLEIAQSYEREDPRIKVFALPINSGAATARNHSLANAKGEYIAFLDSDDLWKPTKLERQLDFMLTGDYAFTFTNYELMDEDGHLLSKELKMPQSLSYNQYLRNTAIGCLTVVVNREKIGDFSMLNIRAAEDMSTWLRFLKKVGKAYALKENLATYRLVGNSVSSKKLKSAKDVWRCYRDIEHLSLARSIYSFVGYAFHAIKKRL